MRHADMDALLCAAAWAGIFISPAGMWGNSRSFDKKLPPDKRVQVVFFHEFQAAFTAVPVNNFMVVCIFFMESAQRGKHQADKSETRTAAFNEQKQPVIFQHPRDFTNRFLPDSRIDRMKGH